MPAKFTQKQFETGAVYHIYNKGIDGREVFQGEVDFREFEKLMERYLGEFKVWNNPRFKGERPYLQRRKMSMNLKGKVELLAYCLMPSHFHLLVRQLEDGAMTQLMRRMLTNYVMGYNLRHRRKGPLFEGVYRAAKVAQREQIPLLTRMIHLNPATKQVKRFGPVETVATVAADQYPYSSYKDYLNWEKRDWVITTEVDWRGNEYRQFVEAAGNEKEGVVPGLLLD